ncbi:hypothetical protein BCV72DRAFT_57624 [Rhizopus microsporus var. microsporus]|uniref:Uncharacterized protein n=1 Tax=Rhizopus microsporus var. microsporus TaxID=86635 RepID=A0A1X0QQW5_RHIZD|nr:hypothetical protein BCV72DRAFT_57624 [Rhizopus microsporus var. microsporus]
MKTYSRGISCGRNICPIPYCKVSVNNVDGCSGNVEWASDCRLIRFGSGYSNKSTETVASTLIETVISLVFILLERLPMSKSRAAHIPK